jgi:hypothetical protein
MVSAMKAFSKSRNEIVPISDEIRYIFSCRKAAYQVVKHDNGLSITTGMYYLIPSKDELSFCEAANFCGEIELLGGNDLLPVMALNTREWDMSLSGELPRSFYKITNGDMCIILYGHDGFDIGSFVEKKEIDKVYGKSLWDAAK